MLKEGINIGDRFLCFRTATYEKRPEDLIFKIGNVYRSYHSGTIQDENGVIHHHFTKVYWTQYLIKLNEEGGIDMSLVKDMPLGDKILAINLLKKYQNNNKNF